MNTLEAVALGAPVGVVLGGIAVFAYLIFEMADIAKTEYPK